MLKNLYARLVLWLIRPALDKQGLEVAERARRTGGEVRKRLAASLKDQGRSLRGHARRESS